MHDTHHSQLVAAGADLDKANNLSYTPLYIASSRGNLGIVKAVGWSCHSQDLDGDDG